MTSRIICWRVEHLKESQQYKRHQHDAAKKSQVIQPSLVTVSLKCNPPYVHSV